MTDSPASWTPPAVYGPGGLFHGPDFQVLRRVEGTTEDAARAELGRAGELGWPADAWHTDPAVMDGAIQLAFLIAIRNGIGPTMPLRIGRIGCRELNGNGGPLACDARVRERTKERLVCDLSVRDSAGTVVAEFDGLELYALSNGAS